MASESIAGKVIVGVAVAAIAGFGGWVWGQVTAKPTVPTVVVTPKSATAPVGEPIDFAVTTNYLQVTPEWSLGGRLLGESSAAYCEAGQDGKVLTCRFAMPGSVAVTAAITTEDGLMASDSVSVKVNIPGGYVAFVFPGLSKSRTHDAYRLFLTSFDWVKIQSSIPRPIILYNPDLKRNVYALAKTKSQPPGDPRALYGVRVLVPNLAEPGRSYLNAKLTELGAVQLSMAFAEINAALMTGLAESSLVTVDGIDSDLVGFSR